LFPILFYVSGSWQGNGANNRKLFRHFLNKIQPEFCKKYFDFHVAWYWIYTSLNKEDIDAEK